MPQKSSEHCLVMVNEDRLLAIGLNIMASYSIVDKEWRAMSMSNAEVFQRREHACGTFTDPETKQTVVVIAGGNGETLKTDTKMFFFGESLNEVPDWGKRDFIWIDHRILFVLLAAKDVSLPEPFVNGKIVTLPDGHGVLAIGGFQRETKNLFRFEAGQTEWEILPQELNANRFGQSFFVMFVPQTYCAID